ncbi:hypothetical protein Q9K02_11425 [Qipengyuania sp. G39]|uniref:Uncharacterized protein n=1 Tax=Qipengyuania profundimaris TaxID=3067652 RepID=A0ABT9HRH6_9SPHN|nr:hypothetical protein [Qipengyuania sp. G39]MDP4575751.1 hypothetical protein [Qipengyuania sp. G39]
MGKLLAFSFPVLGAALAGAAAHHYTKTPTLMPEVLRLTSDAQPGNVAECLKEARTPAFGEMRVSRSASAVGAYDTAKVIETEVGAKIYLYDALGDRPTAAVRSEVLLTREQELLMRACVGSD